MEKQWAWCLWGLCSILEFRYTLLFFLYFSFFLSSLFLYLLRGRRNKNKEHNPRAVYDVMRLGDE